MFYCELQNMYIIYYFFRKSPYQKNNLLLHLLVYIILNEMYFIKNDQLISLWKIIYFWELVAESHKKIVKELLKDGVVYKPINVVKWIN